MSNFLALLGLQFGDEGKGKIIDFIAHDYDYVVRYQGGDNAGHTVNFNNKKFILRMIPSGIFKTKVIIAPGTVVNPINLIEEISNLNTFLDTKEKLFISDKAHVIFDFHIEWDSLMEKIRSSNNVIGTTNKGIGPCYSDKSSRLGLRLMDLSDFDSLYEKLKINLETKNPLFLKHAFKVFCPKETAKKYHDLYKVLSPYFINYFEFLREEVDKNKKFLFEGSQGMLLDLDCGTYPYVTSSNIIGALSHGANLPAQMIKNVMGIMKAYTSRVGNGKFITEIEDEKISNYIRVTGNEFGSVTNRPRRVGWLDLALVKYSCLIAGITEIVITLVDVLNGLEEINVCVGYKDENGKDLPIHLPHLKANITPIYKKFKAWNDSYEKIKTFSDFSAELQAYILFIESFLKVKISIVSFGKDRNFTIRK